VEKIQIPVIQLSVNMEMIFNFCKNMQTLITNKPKKLAEELKPLQSELHQILKDSNDKLLDIRDLIQELRFYSENKSLEKELVDINGSIDFAISMVKESFKNICSFESELKEIPFIKGHKQDIIQLLLNFFNNAAESFEDSDSKKNLILVKTEWLAKEVKLSIIDNGIGFEKYVKERIFEPFFTLKNNGNHQGVGLAINKKIVDEMNGRIDVDSKLKHGSTFTVFFKEEG